jgi:hypothetical protein
MRYYARKINKMKNTILTSREADAVLQTALIDGAKWIIARKTDTVLYQGKTINFTPLRSGGVLLEVY